MQKDVLGSDLETVFILLSQCLANIHVIQNGDILICQVFGVVL